MIQSLRSKANEFYCQCRCLTDNVDFQVAISKVIAQLDLCHLLLMPKGFIQAFKAKVNENCGYNSIFLRELYCALNKVFGHHPRPPIKVMFSVVEIFTSD